MNQKVGTIKEIWQYPVKSMSGNQVTSAQLVKTGVVGDRLWTIWDEIDQQLVGGKNFRKIMRLAATYQETDSPIGNSTVNISFPDGQIVASNESYLDDLLSSFIGHPVSLKQKQADKIFYLATQKVGGLAALRQRLGMPSDDSMKNLAIFPLGISLMLQKYATPPGFLHDVYPIHFLTTNTLNWLRKAHSKAAIDRRRFRPNFLIEGSATLGDYPEKKWQNGYLEIGNTVLKVGIPTIRCSMPAQAQPGLKEDLEVAKAIQITANQFVGSYGTVLEEGSIQAGDVVVYRPAKKIGLWWANLGRKLREPSTKLLAKFEQKSYQSENEKTKQLTAEASLEKNGFESFKVIKTVQESKDITSFYLKGKNYYSFLPGQHLLLGLLPPEQTNPIIRAYSLSAFKSDDKTYRISVKREKQPALASNYLHDELAVGSEIYIKRPQGQFFLHPQTTQPVVLISMGVGITPFISMLDYAIKTKHSSKITLLHGCRNEECLPFKKELIHYEKSENISIHLCYSQPEPTTNFQSKGRINLEIIKRVADSTKNLFYLCGTDAFMRAIYKDLISWGVNPSAIFYEQFSRAAPLGEDVDKLSQTSYTIHFQKSNLKTTWTPAGQSLLALAENCGLQPDFGCRYGICEACSAKLNTGFVTYDEGVPIPKDRNNILLCCAKPLDDLVIEL